jgi:hypothetical protein
MRKASGLVSSELPDLVLVEVPIEIQGALQGFLDFDRSLDQFWSNYGETTGVAPLFTVAHCQMTEQLYCTTVSTEGSPLWTFSRR